jgi:hypothetical protein
MRRLTLTFATTLLTLLLFVPPARAADWTWPLRGEVITPYRNGDDPYAAGQHRGIDIAGDPGAAVVAATAGEVRFAGTAGSSGLTVSVRTADGRYDTSYLHLSSVSVREGDHVGAGEHIGAVGMTGVRSAERPHLHFGVRDAGSRHAYHDPLAFLPPPAAPPAPAGAPATQAQPVPAGPAAAPAAAAAPRVGPAPAGGPARAGQRIPLRVPGLGRTPLELPARRTAPAGAPTPHPTAGGRRAWPATHADAARSTAPALADAVGQRATAPARHAGAPAHGVERTPARGGATTPVRASATTPARAGATTPDHATMRAGARGAAGPAASPAGHRTSLGLPHRATASALDTGATGGHAHRQPGAPAAAPGSRIEPHPGGAPGPDIGLVLACLGLLAAAALLGLKADGPKAGRRAATGLRRRPGPTGLRRRPGPTGLGPLRRSVSGRLASRG